MDLTKEEKKAIKLAVECVRIIRRERHAFGEGLYITFHAENQERHHKRYQEMSEAIKILEGLK